MKSNEAFTVSLMSRGPSIDTQVPLSWYISWLPIICPIVRLSRHPGTMRGRASNIARSWMNRSTWVESTARAPVAYATLGAPSASATPR
jgi:hypothetical protein